MARERAIIPSISRSAIGHGSRERQGIFLFRRMLQHYILQILISSQNEEVTDHFCGCYVGLIAGYKVAAGSDKAVAQWSTAFAGSGNAILSLVARDPEETVYSYAKVHEDHLLTCLPTAMRRS